MRITVLCFIGLSVSSSWNVEGRNSRNLSFSNILRNYLTKYPSFKEKSSSLPLDNRQKRRKFPYKIVPPAQLNNQKTAKIFPQSPLNHQKTVSQPHFLKTTNFEQNPRDKNARNFMQNREANFIQNFREFHTSKPDML